MDTPPVATALSRPVRAVLHADHLKLCGNEGLIPVSQMRFGGRLTDERVLTGRDVRNSVVRSGIALRPAAPEVEGLFEA